jgi:AraC family transcriptional regulator, regulatory protein of adaptative response / methylphosphotriester-DNA alkyltransferase methyltransferase
MSAPDPGLGATDTHLDLMHRPATIRLRTSLFGDAVAIVEREYAQDLSLDDIARRVASSRRQLQRAYREIGRTTFREHLTAVRMERAGQMLATRGLTVRDVARRVGYRQPAQFAKAFRRHHGVAPSDYRATARIARADAPSAGPSEAVA